MSDSHQISLQEAAQLTSNYRNTVVPIIVTALTGQKGQSFPVTTIQTIMAQPGVVSIRIYYGMELLPPAFKLIIVGVDANGNDVTTGIIADKGIVCPPVCGVPNVLNSNNP